MAFFFKHLNLSGKITNHSLQREERLEVPYKALREALINSLCHRQWERYNLTNNIAIYDDRIEIGNPGVFPPEITPETIKNPHDSYPYNSKIAEALYRTTWLENWGTGAKRIIEACREQRVEEPTWRRDGGSIYVTFKRPSKQDLGGHISQNIENVPQNGHGTQESTQEKLSGTQETSSSTQETVLSTQEKILMMLKAEPTLTTSEVASRLGTTRDGIRKILDKLRQDGRLVREGSTKSGKWIVNNDF